VAKTPTDIRSLARKHTESAIRTLANIMSNQDSPAAARVAAAQVILDRGWGKPTQPISGDEDGPPIRFERIELVAIRPEGFAT
jgi:hypothetical protein